MVKNTTGGNKHKKQKNSSIKTERPLIIKQEQNEGYGQVITFLGGSMVTIRKLGTNLQFRCRLRKSLPRVFKNDIILFAIREFESKEVGDVILVYTSDEVNILKKEKYIEVEAELDQIFQNNELSESNENIESNQNNLDEEKSDIDMNDL
jgi:initiation factor 1A